MPSTKYVQPIGVPFWAIWRAAQGSGSSSRPYWVFRCKDGPGRSLEAAEGASGRTRTFSTWDAAKRAASILNNAEGLTVLRFHQEQAARCREMAERKIQPIHVEWLEQAMTHEMAIQMLESPKR